MTFAPSTTNNKLQRLYSRQKEVSAANYVCKLRYVFIFSSYGLAGQVNWLSRCPAAPFLAAIMGVGIIYLKTVLKRQFSIFRKLQTTQVYRTAIYIN